MTDWLETGGSWLVLIIMGVFALAMALILALTWSRPKATPPTPKKTPVAASPPPPSVQPPQPARPSASASPAPDEEPLPPPARRPEGIGAASEPPRPRPYGQMPQPRTYRAERSRTDPPASPEAAPRMPLPAPPIPAPVASGNVGDDRGEFVAVTVHYGTDRKDTGIATDLAARFTSERADISGNREPVSYGTTTVSIPKTHAVGGLEDRTWWQWATWQDRTPDKHVMVMTVTPAAAAAFFATLKSAVARSGKKDAFVFVHGFSVSFADAARRTAQMAYDLEFQGAPVMFTWPTPDLSTSLFTAYTTSESNVDLSKHRFQKFLQDVLDKTGAATVHVIAHSMGNRLVTEALQMLDTPENAHLKAKIGEVILTAPDIDASVFITEIAPRILRFAPRITLYASSKDKALEASQGVHSFPRIGEFQSMMSVPTGIEVIDASSVYDDAVGHSYYGDSEPVIGDLCYLLSLGDRAAHRSLTLTGALTPGGQACWSVIKKPLADVYAAIAARGHA